MLLLLQVCILHSTHCTSGSLAAFKQLLRHTNVPFHVIRIMTKSSSYSASGLFSINWSSSCTNFHRSMLHHDLKALLHSGSVGCMMLSSSWVFPHWHVEVVVQVAPLMWIISASTVTQFGSVTYSLSSSLSCHFRVLCFDSSAIGCPSFLLLVRLHLLQCICLVQGLATLLLPRHPLAVPSPLPS